MLQGKIQDSEKVLIAGNHTQCTTTWLELLVFYFPLFTPHNVFNFQQRQNV